MMWKPGAMVVHGALDNTSTQEQDWGVQIEKQLNSPRNDVVLLVEQYYAVLEVL